jgi:hypothetical protein
MVKPHPVVYRKSLITMIDFTLSGYILLLKSLNNAGYAFITVEEYFFPHPEKFIMLRHDVDGKKENSLRFAEIQHDLGIKGTYYFRMVPESFDPVVIKKIAALNHEIGYHYEDMDFAYQNAEKKSVTEDDLFEPAWKLFNEHLQTLRNLTPIKTICMHGSPRSKFDNKAVWKKFNYKDCDIIGEPYFDINFSEVFYLTDTGRRWDGSKVSVRDKVADSDTWKNLSFRSTQEFINRIEKGEMPEKIMVTFHPQRWTDNPLLWVNEYVTQNVKNYIKKRFFVR